MAMLLYEKGRKDYLAADHETALRSFSISRGLCRQLGELMCEGGNLLSIGTVYRATGEYRKGLDSCQEALVIYKAIDDRSGEGAALQNIGVLYAGLGEYQQALYFLQEALIITKEAGDLKGEGSTLSSIGVIYETIGEYQQALDYLQQALTIWKAIGGREGEGAVLNNIGMIYEAFGKYQQALRYLQEALPIQRAIGDREGEGGTLSNIGAIYDSIGERQDALASYQEALAIFKAIGNHNGEGATLNNISLLYKANKEYQLALAFYDEALTIARAIGNRTGEGVILGGIGMVHEVTGEYQKALDYLQESLTIRKMIGNQAGEEKVLENIGYVYEQQKQWREAGEYYQQAIALLEAIRSKTGGSEAKESFLGQHIKVYIHTVQCLLQLNAPEEAFAYTERSKARSFLEQLYEVSTGVKCGVDSQLFAEETNLYGKLAVIEQNLKEQINDEQREQLLEKRHALEHELSVIQMKLRTSNPCYAELKYPQPATVEQVQQEILKEGEIIVEYLQGDEELYVFIIGKSRFFTHTIEIKAQDLYGSITQFLEPLQSASHEKLNHEFANQLYQILFQPIEQKIVDANSGKDIQHLVIVPDGVLFYLPFEMLVTQVGETPEYLVDRYTISYSPSASVLKPEILQTRQPEQYAQDLLALAPFAEEGTEITKVALISTENLLLSDTLRSGLEGIQPLPYSAREVQTISSLYPQSVCQIGADATKAYFTDHAKGNRYLHLSTHGYLDNQHAMYSGLLFSDGMLQTYEIFNLDIDAELTVLSACQTGLGELKAGEGLVGLTRAFMYAGSPSVLVSLWPVSDPSTAAFMKRFYRNLNRGMTKAEALRETKIWMKEKSYHTDEHGNVIKHDNPFYWAPFILVGAHE
ncbi:MAG: CHAT domain-containing tetratricopeptide repeat protein [Candidatus Vecturithrix sp.]|nr:CHAT domain-containing tetratricopeptide repeat protein [Candidatus Vecturithrix sp.]